MKYAGFWKRFAARLIDYAVFLPLIIINIVLIKPIGKDVFYGAALTLSALTILYNVLFVYYKEKTPGKAVMKIKITKTDGSRVGLANSILREVLAVAGLITTLFQDYKIFGNAGFIHTIDLIVSTVGGLECLLYFFNANCKTLHDYIANTVVIDEANGNRNSRRKK